MSRLTINSNIPSLNAQRSLLNATKKLGDSYTRLSSGLRINKSSDDAAGLSISESLKSDTRLFNQGIRNLNDGVSLLNIADGALNELSNITIRLRELATQSANGTFSNKQRLALDQEAQSLSKEYNRIARTTEFNGRKIFNGDFGDLSLAAGGGRESLIVDNLGGGIGDGTYKKRISYQAAVVTGPMLFEDFTGDNIDDLIFLNSSVSNVLMLRGNNDGSFSSAEGINTVFNSIAISSADFNLDGKLDFIVSQGGPSNSISLYLGNGDGSFNSAYTMAVSGVYPITNISDFNDDGYVDIAVTDGSTNSTNILISNGNGTFKSRVSYFTPTSGDTEIADFNGDGILDIAVAETGTASILIGNGDGTFRSRISLNVIHASLAIDKGDFNNDGIVDLVFAAGTTSVAIGNGDGTFKGIQQYAPALRNVWSHSISDYNGDGYHDIISADYAVGTISYLGGNGDGTFRALISYESAVDVHQIISKDINADGVIDLVTGDYALGTISVYLANSNSGVSALQSFSLKTKQDSKEAMDYLSGALNRISKQRGEIGAFQSRLDVATSTLQTSALNYQEANSRITDIDVAEESSRLSAAQILQQSASSILAQANLQPQLVLNLLRDF